jgi:diacylglycerol kinase (ATP)
MSEPGTPVASVASSDASPVTAPAATASPSDQPASASPPVVILNPASKSGRRLRGWLKRALKDGRGELALTSAPRDAERIASEAALAGRAVVAVGGDGTIAEVANGILASGARVPLGIIPAGNGNDYAYHTLGLPHDVKAALELALTGAPQAMDAGQVNGRYFVNTLGVGIDANIAAAAISLKRVPFLRGQALYYAASLRELIFHYDRCPSLTVAHDGEVRERAHYAMATIALGPTAGGGFKINPGADPRDGRFDLCLITKPAQLRALRLLPMVEKGQHTAEPEVKRLQAQTVTLEADGPVYAHLDGEVITAPRFEARILPGALLVRQAQPHPATSG